MAIKSCVTTMLVAGAVIAASPAIAEHDEDWDWRVHVSYAKKAKHKKKGWAKQAYYSYQPVSNAHLARCPPAQRADGDRSAQNAPPAPVARAPGAFPRESRELRRSTSERQREILEKELATEEELLQLARRERLEEEARVGPDGEQAAQGLRSYSEKVDLHERNVAALRRELGRVPRQQSRE